MGDHDARRFGEPVQYVSKLAEIDVNIEIEWTHSFSLLLIVFHVDEHAKLGLIDQWTRRRPSDGERILIYY